MRKTISLLLVLVGIFLFNSKTFGQLLFEENFDYPVGDSLTIHGWVQTGTSIVNRICVTDNNLAYANYLSITGKSAGMTKTGQDVKHSFTTQTSGSVYAAFLVKVDSANATGDYFLHFNESLLSSTNFRGKVFVKKDAASDNIAFGISKGKNVADATFTNFNYALGTTYLLVVKYTFNAGSSDDQAFLFVNPTDSVTPTLTAADVATSTDIADITFVALRQGNASNASVQTVDGIRVGTNWADVLPSGSVVAVTGVILDTDSFVLNITGTQQLTPTISPANATNQNVTWATSNASIATVSNTGLVTAVAEGNATITVTTQDGGFLASCEVTVNSAPAGCFDLFISEYVEGSANNKAIEIYNPTNQPISLSNYKLVRYSNGGTSGTDVALGNAIIPSYGTYVVVLDKRNPQGTGIDTMVDLQLQAKADTFLCPVYNDNSMMYFNGNDAISLEKIDGTIVDVFGKIGQNPAVGNGTGSEGGWNNIDSLNYCSGQYYWTAWTMNHTMTRKANVRQGILQNPAHFNTGIEWDSLPNNTFANLRMHTSTCAINISVTGVSLSPTTLTLNEGETSQLTATISPANATNQSVTWASLNPSVATVSNTGLVTAVTEGNTTITVTTVDGNFTAVCAITVTNDTILVTGVTLSQTSANLNVSETLQLTATVLPENATNKNISWSTSNAAVATVNNGFVIAISEGNATITVTTEDGNFTANCEVAVSNVIPTDLLFEENFDYTVGDSLRAHNWEIQGTTTFNTVSVSANNLTYENYASVTGNSAFLDNSGQDVKHFFTAQNSGSVYAAFLVKLDSAKETGDYFVHFNESVAGSTNFRGRVFAKKDAASNNIAFGISRAVGNTGTVTYTNFDYSLGTTYLLVLKYTINSGSTTDDIAELFVNPTINGVEPSSNVVSTDNTANDLIDIAAIALRQGTATAAPDLTVDGIRVGTSWQQLFPSNDPTLFLSVDSLDFEATMIGQTKDLSYTVLGRNLTNDISLSCEAPFQISLTEGTGFANTLTIPKGTGTVNSVVYVRFSPTSEEEYSKEILHASTGATNVSLKVKGIGQSPDNQKPVIKSISHDPLAPTTNDEITITATITDDESVASVTLEWGYNMNFGNPVAVVSGDSVYSAIIPAQSTADSLCVKITATDNKGVSSDTTFKILILQSVVPIYNIQYTTDASGNSPYAEKVVMTQGIVTAVAKKADLSVSAYFIQDSAALWNGVYVYDNQHPNVAVGDKVKLTALVTEYNGLTELKTVTEFEVISQNNPLPAFVNITIAQAKTEGVEGILVRIDDVRCAKTKDSYGESKFVKETTDTITVDDIMYKSDPKLNCVYLLQGVGYYSFNIFKIEPRDSTDLVLKTSVNNPPVIENIMLLPAAPTTKDSVYVSFDLYDDNAVVEKHFYYGSSANSITTELPMVEVGLSGKRFKSLIPKQAAGTVYYKIVAKDNEFTTDTVGNYPVIVGINSLSTANILISPNPASEKFVLQGLDKNVSVNIYNVTGKLISSLKTNSETFEVNIVSLEKGIYFVTIINEKGFSKTLKLIKE